MASPTLTTQDILSRTKREGLCVVWARGKDKDGYGQFQINKKKIKAHRWFYEHFVGSIPEGMLVRHTCHNPSCVLPAHLRVGTAQDNANDQVEADRTPRMRVCRNCGGTKTKVKKQPQVKWQPRTTICLECGYNVYRGKVMENDKE